MDKPRWPDEPVCHGQSVSEAFATILTHNFGRLDAWQVAARDWGDIEGVHQLRVAFRRMRSACATFRPAVPGPATRRWRRRMRRLAGALGPARDLDVLVSEVLEPHAGALQLPGGEAFTVAVATSRARAYRQVRRMLDGKRYARFRRDFPGWCASRAWQDADAAKLVLLQAPIEAFATELLAAQFTVVHGTGEAAAPDDALAMHRLRIECKKLRYLAEFFRGLFDGMEPFIAHLKALQDLLGVMHDVAVTADLVDSIVGRTSDHALQRFAGALVGWRSHELLLLRGQFAERWSEFTRSGLPWDGDVARLGQTASGRPPSPAG